MLDPMELGPYRELAPLGRGAMGVVYRARSPEGREVAIKVLARTSPAALERFERERRLLASFGEAAGFVPLLDAGSAPAGAYIVMPYLAGGTLRAKLESGPLGVAETLRLGRALCAAIGQAHARGVIHRDLKPENVLFTADGRPLVADLGLAKHFDASVNGASQSVSLSTAGEVRGTAGYMPPEQIESSKAVGPAADVFALGAILHECLAGRPAFQAATVVELLTKVCTASPEPLARLAPDAPWLVAAIERALAREPGRRFPDALALGRALAAAPKASKAGRPALVVLGIGIGFAAAAAFFSTRRGSPPVAPPPAPTPPARVAPLPASPAPPARSPGAELEKSSYKKLRAHDLDGAIEDATGAIALDPKLAAAWVNRGAARLTKDDLDGAIEDMTRAIELDPTIAVAWMDRGAAREEKHDPEGALADYTHAIECAPKMAAGWAARGNVLVDKGDYASAVDDLTRSIELEPGRGDTWKQRGIARQRLGDNAGAISDCKKFLELSPGDPEVPRIREWLRQAGGL